MELIHTLNPSQREAVTTLSGPLLVLAGAGTGKTRVITYRMGELIRRGTPAERILSVTFTNKAAREMQERARQLLGRRLRTRPVVSTFHSLCVRILREECEVLCYPRTFSICDRGDQESLARKALSEVRVTGKVLSPGDLLTVISRWKTDGVEPPQAAKLAETPRDVLAAVAYRRYQQALRAQAAVDFDDLLLLTWRLFSDHPRVLEKHQNRFDHVQIDEYQDTNEIQFLLAEALVRQHRCLCAVGDDDQSIYGFRGARVEHILSFQSHFPGAKIVRLEENYRSSDRIIAVANRLVRCNRDRHEKRLIPQKISDSEVRFLEFADETREAAAVAQEIAQLIATGVADPGEIAILFRTNEQPRLFEAELRRLRIPYQLIGSQSFFDRKEVRDIFAYLKVLANPADDVSLLRVVNVPSRGIGDATVQRINEWNVRERCGFWKAADVLEDNGSIPARAAKALHALRATLDTFRPRFEHAPKKMTESLLALIESIGYEREIKRLYDKPEQQQARTSTLDQLADSMSEYVARAAAPTLSGYLEESLLAGRDDQSDKEDRLAENAVKLLTLHCAKGLEFPHVYLVGLEEGLLPHRHAITSGEGIAEERRLAYVGITRAMDELTVTRAASRRKWGKPRPSIPSRFVYEMQGIAVDPQGEADGPAGTMLTEVAVPEGA